MHLPPEEPWVSTWQVVPLVSLLPQHMSPGGGGRSVLAVDGRSSSGKTTLAARLSRVQAAAVVHTDDVAWWHSRFGWTDRLVRGVVAPFKAGNAVSYRPPEWEERRREGSIEVGSEVSILIIEGVGSSRRDLSDWLDGSLWVQADDEVRRARDEQRIAAGETTPSRLAAWLGEESPFLAAEQPWARAGAIVAGAPEVPHDPETQAVIATPEVSDLRPLVLDL